MCPVLWLWAYSWKQCFLTLWWNNELYEPFRLKSFPEVLLQLGLAHSTHRCFCSMFCLLDPATLFTWWETTARASAWQGLHGADALEVESRVPYPGEHRGTAKVGLQRGERTSNGTNNISKLIFWASIQIPWIVNGYIFPWWYGLTACSLRFPPLFAERISGVLWANENQDLPWSCVVNKVDFPLSARAAADAAQSAGGYAGMEMIFCEWYERHWKARKRESNHVGSAVYYLQCTGDFFWSSKVNLVNWVFDINSGHSSSVFCGLVNKDSDCNFSFSHRRPLKMCAEITEITENCVLVLRLLLGLFLPLSLLTISWPN